MQGKEREPAMRIILSPAKKMSEDADSLPWRDLPRFLPDAERLAARLRAMSLLELKRLWGCNDLIADLNFRRVQTMDLRRNLTPALLAYEGIQYRCMAPRVFERGELDYAEEHLRILSGFYGMLRPFDGVTPYRLEMQARLKGEGFESLYEFWGDRLARQLSEETRVVINLASREYSRCVVPLLPEDVRVVTCVFGEFMDGRLVEKGTLCKMARGEMVRFLAGRQAESPEEMREFDRLGYRFAGESSDKTQYRFIKGDRDESTADLWD